MNWSWSWRKAPWKFDNSLIAIQQPCVSPSNLAFDTDPIWIQIHDFPMDWRIESIVHKIVETIRPILYIDKLSLLSGTMRLLEFKYTLCSVKH